MFAFRRALPGNAVQVTVNLSGQPQRTTLAGAAATLAPWDYRIEVKEAAAR